MGIYNTLIFTEALSVVKELIHGEDLDRVSGQIEEIATNEDLAMASIMLLVFHARGVDIDDLVGAELANAKPTSLYIPKG